MLTSCFRPILEKCCGQEQHGGDKDELLWHLDLKPHASGEFSIAVVQANNTLEDQSQVMSSPSSTYIGVYDGHGGPDASRFITHYLFPHLQKLAAEQGGISAEVIKRAFELTEHEFLRRVKNTWITQPQILNVGSCCLVGVICGDVLYVANLGDSRAVLGRRMSDRKRGPVVAERLTTDHNVAVEEVRKEVEALHPDDAHVVVFTRGVWRIKGIIQVSRSIGDVYLKKPEYHRDPLFQQFAPPVFLKRAVMTAEPSIQIRKLGPQDLFLIFASDGLWEQLSDEEVVDMVVKSPRSGIAKRLVRAALKVAVKKRDRTYEDVKSYGKGDRRNYHDDITVIVIYLDHRSGPQKGGFDIFKETNSPRDIYTQNMDDADDRPLNPSVQ